MDNSILEGLLDKQERITVADQIYQKTRQLLMSGAVPPGEKVTLRGLAAVLNTSPMPVREAVNNANFELLIGFQLTESQLAYNAAR